MPGSKNYKKNGKDSGGVIAAVTKHATRFSTKGLSSSPSPPSIEPSPEIAPTSRLSNGNPAISPSLDAISTTSLATSNSPNAREWMRGVSAAGMAGSPGNLISLVGESPPTAPSSYEDTRGGSLASGWSSPRPGANYHVPPSASPPAVARRPLSFQMENHYSPPDVHGRIAAAMSGTTANSRRSSMHSHFAQMRGPGSASTAATSNPPLPHQPQAHFYGAPDIDLDPQSRSGMRAGDKGYYFGFDTVPMPDADRATGRDNVVLAGYEGGLDVHLVGKRGLEHLGSLKGLRGGVYHAKVLPWTADTRNASADLHPLVAVVVHGPHLPAPAPGINVENDYDAVSTDRSDAMGNVNSLDGNNRDTISVATRASSGYVESYQTTVEVYSLKTSRLVGVLLEAPKIPLKTPITSAIFKAPTPSGAFHIHADGGNIMVSSGITGECWVYRQFPAYPHEQVQAVQFRCLGKLWTTLQQPLKGDAAQEAERSRIPVPPRPRPQSAIVSMNGRWIAYCPPSPSSQIALRASVPVPAYGRAPGLNTMTPPQLPPANSDVDLPLSESVMNKIMRDATQELIHGARWVGKQGLQAWNNYWNPQSSHTARSPPSLTSYAWGGGGGASEQSQFPPTHGSVTPPVAKEPGLVSIVDIETMGASANLHPVTTFTIPQGCSFLSFSPTGLSLFTASSKGDVQTVWDLMRIQHTKASPIQTNGLIAGGPRVRQVAQFSRMTVARIVDVAWTKPNGERAAMVTERGTVHLLDLPSSAFTWPPPRRRTQPQDAKGAITEGTTSAVSIASNALNSVRDAARPLITRPRRSSSNVPQLTGSGIGEYATHGGKVIAASISHSLGKTGNAINQLRHTGENRVSLPSTSTVPGPSCVVWITGRKNHSLFVLGGGLVRTFPSKSRGMPSAAASNDKRGPRLPRYKDFKVPSLPDDALAPYVKNIIDPDEYLEFTERDLDAGNNTLVLDQNKPRAHLRNLNAESSIPQAEIEASAPYQPFHTDRRLGLFEHDGATLSDRMASLALNEEDMPAELATPPRRKSAKGSRAAAPSQAASQPSGGAFAFGLPIQAIKLDFGLPHISEEESFSADPAASRALPPSAMERILHRDDDDQIVVTTRRRRGAASSHAAGNTHDDDGFFEDDCEVLDFADQRV
ncbi:hypothetical protein QBC46DRAFT_398636 [Diplogelasinospora grovesii]|uniref:Uncharacterized protein n=1 Tax=Diplogelasinospora grovesii TaxID=303347 RepID=A0AAN6MYN6_9PEZI|nr:hypothetical protein QBC46DRAFT_398636 [Diplogelasinospora grovesii]